MSDDEIESVCVHCGVPIMRLTLAGGRESFWTHIPNEGPIYLRFECGLVATPSDSEVPS